MLGVRFASTRVVTSLFELRLPEADVRRGVMAAAGFNFLGFPIQLLIGRHRTDIPVWPELLSMAVGLVIWGALSGGALKGRLSAVKGLFLLNAAFVSFALWQVYTHFNGQGVPFQAVKLGTLVAGMLAPGFLVGLIAIGIHTGAGVLQYLMIPGSFQSAIQSDEPWALLAFGLGGCFILVNRLRLRQLQLEMARVHVEIETERRLAHAFLELRDLMNTPIQSIEIAVVLLNKKESHHNEIIENLHRSCLRLKEISASLNRFQHSVDWEKSRGGLGDGKGKGMDA